MSAWNPDLYLKFERERTQPAIDLVARIDVSSPQRIIDIGCGPGNSTKILKDRFPNSHIVGVDNSAEMIDKAKNAYPWGEWILADAAEYQFTGKYDIIFSNAALQWIPDHQELIERAVKYLSTEGTLAIQVPGNYDSPIKRSLKQLSERPDWAGFLFEAVNAIRYRTPEFYYDVLSAMNLKIDLWTTTYYHILDSVTEIIEWYSSTGMRPYLNALPDDSARTAFVSELSDLIHDQYPKQTDGRVIFPFRRILFIASV